MLAGPSAAQADRPLAKRTLYPQRFVAGSGCNAAARQVVRLPRRTRHVRVLRPRVGTVFGDLLYDDPAATLTGIDVSRRRVAFAFLGDRACSDRYLAEDGWEVELLPIIRVRRVERIFVTSHLGTRVRPRTMTVGASQQFLNLRWRNWGRRVARARGTFPWNDCAPYCARGTITNRPMRVALSRPRMCAGRLQYMRVTYRIAGGPRQWFSTRYLC